MSDDEEKEIKESLKELWGNVEEGLIVRSMIFGKKLVSVPFAPYGSV